MTAKGQLMPLGASSLDLNFREKWRSQLSTDKQGFLMKSSQWREASSREKGSSPSPPPGSSQATVNMSQPVSSRECEVTLCKKMQWLKVLAWQGKAWGAVFAFSLILLTGIGTCWLHKRKHINLYFDGNM